MSDVSTETAYPLTPFQTAIYLGEQFGDGPSSYHIPIGMRIEGPIDPARMQTALEQVMRRHTILCVTMSLESGRLVQRLHLDRPLTWHMRDCSRDADADASAASAVTEFASRPFDLARELPLRAALLKVRDDLHVVVLVIHHAVFDGWSRQLLVRELMQQYERMASAQATPLPPLRRQYVHYALERAREDTDAMARAHRDYLQALLRTPDVLLPTDMPRRAASDFRADNIPLSLTGEIVRRLHAFMRDERMTSFVFFLAIFNLLLHLRAGRGGARIAFPVNCRERPEDLELIGCFVNTLLLRVDVDLERSFSDCLQRVRDAVMQVLPFKNHPLQTAGRESTPDAGYGARSAYRVMFAFQQRMPDEQAGQGLRIEPFVGHTERTKCDLTLLLDDDGRNATGAIEYRSDLFHRSTIERMRRTYLTLVHQALDRPQARLRDLLAQAGDDLGEASAPARPRRDPPAAGTWTPVPERISAWAQRAPDRIALESGQGSLSFAGLDRLSDGWCEVLRARGVGTEDRVGVAIDLGMAAIVAMLAIMKAGAAYVPMDLDGPRARLEPQIRASAMQWILCANRRHEAELFGARLLHVDEMSPEQPASSRPGVVPSAEMLAYIIYTSGSSGAPKGVMITHGGLSNYLSWCTEHYRMHEAPTLTQTSLLSDMTVTTIWGPLIVGQRVCVADALPGIEGLRAALSLEPEYSVVKMTPSHLRILKHEPERFAARAWCRTCVLGGEALNWADVEPWMQLGMRLVNEYGPTETVVGSLVYAIEGFRGERAVPIGVPVRDTTMRLLDERLCAVPAGTAGEIGIGGAGVGRGYERQPALTAASFIPDDSGDRAGARMYRTGDLGVRLGDGNVQFLGRRDDQLKIRGYRVERDEVEAAIASHPDVRHAVALLQDEEEASLVAHIELAPGAHATARELQDFLRRLLPAHMIPRLFRFVERMRLLANGKVDRRSVLEQERRLPAGRAQAPVAPQSHGLELRILAVWREVLGNDAIEPTDHFFEVGGDSIRLYAVYRQLLDITGQDFPAVAMFEYPTVRSCAEYLWTRRSDMPDAGPTPQDDPEQADLERQRLLGVNAALRRRAVGADSLHE
jgi:amino acid adenylation domain-containing protein